MTLFRLPLFLAAAISTLTFADPAGDNPQPRVKFPTGKETVAKFTMPPGFVAKCFASEPEVRKPIAIDFDSRGRVWVLECLTYPLKAPPGQGQDRIRIFEDTDGDGVADKVSTFAEGLNLATGMALGYGGVFVGAAPEMLFLQDTDGDDKADKTTVLLDGWGFQDTHETLNSFIWGPDGWLYGCHGVFTHSNVGRPGCKPQERVKLNAGIWRFHPKTHAFELFAEGGSNQWGYDYDEHGEGFFACCVIPHLFHVIPGGRYARQAGQNFNPYNFGEIKWICEDLHYYGNIPHQANMDPRSLKYGGGHAHAGCLIYQGGAYPTEWNGKILMNNIHGGRINADKVRPNGSTYIGNYHGDLLVSNDPNFRVVQLRTGPDGSIFMIDWYDPLICHNTDPSVWNRNYGRIYKLEYHGKDKPNGKHTLAPGQDMAKLTTRELINCLTDDNSWVWRKALLLLAERDDPTACQPLRDLTADAKNPPLHRLRYWWAQSTHKQFANSDAWIFYSDPDPYLRAWAVRLISQSPEDAAASQTEFRALAETEEHPVVLRELASACQRLEPKLRRELAAILAGRNIAAKDPVLPFLIWLAEEPVFMKDKSWATPYALLDRARGAHAPIALGKATKATPNLLRDDLTPRRLRRLAAGNAGELNEALSVLGAMKEHGFFTSGASGLLDGLRGRRLDAPPAWQEVVALRQEFAGAPELLRKINLIGIHFGETHAALAMEKEAADAGLDASRRMEAVRALALARLQSSARTLLALASAEASARLRTEALRALGNFNDADIPTTLLATWPKAPAEIRKEIILLLVTKKPWADALLDALKAGTIKKEDLTENDARRILAFSDQALSEKLEAVWGRVRAQTPANIKEMLDKYQVQLRDIPADRAAGKAVFAKNCQTCHKLFGEGYTAGPELTGANRRDPNYLLENVLDPNKLVGKEYYAVTIEDKQGRLHTGLLAEDTPQQVTLKGENDKLTTLARGDIEQMKVSDKSLMPEGLPNNMTDAEFRNLIAYLMEDPFLSQGLIAGPFKMALDFDGPIDTAADPLQTPGVAWKPFAVGPFGVIDMEKQKALAPPTDSTAYVYFEVRSPSARKAILETAADEDLKVWVNGKVVFGRPRTTQPQRLEVELKEGVNKLLFKVHNIYGPSWLWARLADPRRELDVLAPR